jgi:hypothetical protein
MGGNLRIDQLGAQRLEPAERPFFVRPDQARTARYIGREDRHADSIDAEEGSFLARAVLRQGEEVRFASDSPLEGAVTSEPVSEAEIPC